MKKLLLTLLLSTSLSTFALELDFSSDTFCTESPKAQYRNGLYYQPNQQEPFTGENVCAYKGFLKYFSKGNILNGKFDGKWTYWYENGQKKEERNYINGNKDGKFIWFYKNGQIESVARYKDGACFSGC